MSAVFLDQKGIKKGTVARNYRFSSPQNIIYHGGMINMNKQELVKAIAQDTKLTQVDVTKVLNSEEKLVIEALGRGEKVQRTGFVTYKPVYRAARKGFDPIKKVPMDIAPTVGVSAKAGEKLKGAVEGLDVSKFAPEASAE